MYIYILRKSQFQSFDPFRYGNANGKLKALFTRHKLTQVVCSRHFSKLIRVEPGLVVFTWQNNPSQTRVSSVYTTETNPG